MGLLVTFLFGAMLGWAARAQVHQARTNIRAVENQRINTEFERITSRYEEEP